ncbi:hypothetical protein NIES4074_64640 (plasmid) [Cylindrospermum sp. NIES-4074]|nr:hypothetical protein NIES4074_64640 [Cylindrospermum sp. NIES-4074]
MKSKFTYIRLMPLILVLELGFIASPAIARTQDDGRDPVAAAASNNTTGSSIFTSDTASQINDFVGDVKNFVQNDLFNPLGNLVNSALGAIQIPDLNKVLAGIMNGSVNNDPGAVLSETLENKTNGQSSYGIREDLGKYATRTVATGIANQALSQTAQSQMAEVKQATQQDTQESIRLGEESQNLDVTQQILQNLSQQTALTSRVNERMLLEAQQARIDRALSNTLTAQTAKELSAINTADRRKNIAAGNAATQQAGLLIMPGGITLGANQ